MTKTILIASAAAVTFLSVAAYVFALPIEARPVAGACDHRNWPYYESACIRDLRQPDDYVRNVRVIPTVRL